MVNLAGPINARQLEVLQWIAAGCQQGVMKDYTYKTTAVALRGRRLITVTRKGGGWQAELTDAGGHYLRHGTSPDGFWTTSRKTAAAADLAGVSRFSRAAGLRTRLRRVTSSRPAIFTHSRSS